MGLEGTRRARATPTQVLVGGKAAVAGAGVINRVTGIAPPDKYTYICVCAEEGLYAGGGMWEKVEIHLSLCLAQEEEME